MLDAGNTRKRKVSDSGEAGPSAAKKAKASQSRWSEDIQQLVARVEGAEIVLPSLLSPASIRSSVLAPAIAVEKRLRLTRADHHLDKVRTHLITKFRVTSMKGDVSGQKLSTRLQNAIKSKTRATNKAASLYRLTRVSLLSLGVPADDPHYRQLKQTDVRSFSVMGSDGEIVGSHAKDKKVHTQEERKEQRDALAKNRPSWIWEKWNISDDGQGNPKVKAYFAQGTPIATT